MAKKARVQRTLEAVGVGSLLAATRKPLLVVENNNENRTGSMKCLLCVTQPTWRFM